MKWSTMQPRERRTVIIGGAVLFIALFFVWGVKPYLAALGDARDQLETQRDALAREQAAVATARDNPRLQQVADSAMRVMGPRLFAGRDDVMASADLATYLGDVAERARVWLQDASTRPAVVGADGVRTLQVDIRAQSDLRGTLRFLQELERGAKLVRVDRLELMRAPHSSNDDDAETLTINATVSGYAIGAPPAPKRSAPAAPASSPAATAGQP